VQLAPRCLSDLKRADAKILKILCMHPKDPLTLSYNAGPNLPNTFASQLRIVPPEAFFHALDASIMRFSVALPS
jgi:hypothetical protein